MLRRMDGAEAGFEVPKHTILRSPRLQEARGGFLGVLPLTASRFNLKFNRRFVVHEYARFPMNTHVIP